jgi:hypothetical protein
VVFDAEPVMRAEPVLLEPGFLVDLGPEPTVEPEPVFDPGPEPGLATPMGWDPGAAPPPAGMPIVVETPIEEPPVVVTPELVDDPPVFDVPVFEPVDPAAFEPASFEPVGYGEPELSVFDPNEFEVPFEPLVGASDFTEPSVVIDAPFDEVRLDDTQPDEIRLDDVTLDDQQSTQAVAAAAWPEPEVVPPAFDPAAPEPPAATPAEPYPNGLGQALFDGGDDDLPRRVPGASPLGSDADASNLPVRSPGRHLSHQPATGPAPGAERDARPRPERVHDLLTRHLRGIRDGRGDDLTSHVSADRADTEASS